MDAAITVEHLTKRFRRWHAATPHTTLKTALVDRLRRLGTGSANGDDPNRFEVIRDASFTVAHGESLGLIGRNGAGKSTLLKIIAGIYRADAGRVVTRGRIAALIELGAGFHPDFTGRENVMINGIILGLTKREVRERFDRIVEFSEIGEAIEAPVRTYSTGMFMRLAFSIAIHVEPDILLVDEVLSVGDEAFQAKCRDVLEARVRSRRVTMVLVSHDLEAIAAWCDRVLLIDPPTARLYERPAEGIDAYRALLAAAEHEHEPQRAGGAAPGPVRPSSHHR